MQYMNLVFFKNETSFGYSVAPRPGVSNGLALHFWGPMSHSHAEYNTLDTLGIRNLR